MTQKLPLKSKIKEHVGFGSSVTVLADEPSFTERFTK